MPQIAYYLGRPASLWIAVMSRHAGATAANAPAATSPARQHPSRRPRLRAKVTAATVRQKPVSRPGLQPRSARSRDQVAQTSTRPTPITKEAGRDQAER